MGEENGHGVKVAAMIQIALMPDGSVQCRCEGTDRKGFNMMMLTAMQDMVAIFQKQEQDKGAGLIVAPPGSRVKGL